MVNKEQNAMYEWANMKLTNYLKLSYPSCYFLARLLIAGFATSLIINDAVGQGNLNPFVQIHGLSNFSGTQPIGENGNLLRLQLDLINEFHFDDIANEAIFADFERSTMTLSYAHGLSQNNAWGLELPLIKNSSGFMDSMIESWHDIVGLTQGGRDQYPRDQYLIRYNGNGLVLNYEDRKTGIGDAEFFFDRQILDQRHRRLKARASLKIPTGNEEHLFGSGGFGLSLALNGSAELSSNWTLYGAVGANFLETSKVLGSQQKNFVTTATAGVSWQFHQRFGLVTQIDYNSKVYEDTEFDFISGRAGVLNVSLEAQLSDRTRLTAGFTEDVFNRDAAPDFGIHLIYSQFRN